MIACRRHHWLPSKASPRERGRNRRPFIQVRQFVAAEEFEESGGRAAAAGRDVPQQRTFHRRDPPLRRAAPCPLVTARCHQSPEVTRSDAQRGRGPLSPQSAPLNSPTTPPTARQLANGTASCSLSSSRS